MDCAGRAQRRRRFGPSALLLRRRDAEIRPVTGNHRLFPKRCSAFEKGYGATGALRSPPHSKIALTPNVMAKKVAPMKKRIATTVLFSAGAILAATSLALAKPGASDATKSTAAKPAAASTDSSAHPAPDAEMMKQMMELSKTNENHKILGEMAGTFNYTVKMWMDPSGKPTESTGLAVRKIIMDGRYLHGEYSGKFKMPGAEGKIIEMPFKGNSLDAYDNVKKKFISAWIDNMGTGIMLFEGTYDAGTKSFTYTGEYEAMPGMKSKVREVITMADKDHHSMEYYEDRGQGEMKTMEITYTRKK
jgi:hypothetical protein